MLWGTKWKGCLTRNPVEWLPWSRCYFCWISIAINEFEFSEAFKKLESKQHPKIVVVSSSLDVDDQACYQSLGVKQFVNRPLSIDYLQTLINWLNSVRQSTSQGIRNLTSKNLLVLFAEKANHWKWWTSNRKNAVICVFKGFGRILKRKTRPVFPLSTPMVRKSNQIHRGFEAFI